MSGGASQSVAGNSVVSGAASQSVAVPPSSAQRLLQELPRQEPVFSRERPSRENSSCPGFAAEASCQSPSSCQAGGVQIKQGAIQVATSR